MNTKTYKVLKTILEDPNEWHSVPTLAYDVNMTCRQITSILCAYSYLPLTRDRDNSAGKSYVMFKGTPEEASSVLSKVTDEYYGITEDMKDKVYKSLSSVAWMSVSDVMEDTDMNRCDVAHTLNALEGVTTKTNGVLVLYRRDSPEVR